MSHEQNQSSTIKIEIKHSGGEACASPSKFYMSEMHKYNQNENQTHGVRYVAYIWYVCIMNIEWDCDYDARSEVCGEFWNLKSDCNSSSEACASLQKMFTETPHILLKLKIKNIEF